MLHTEEASQAEAWYRAMLQAEAEGRLARNKKIAFT
jgi:hypothetical protein